MFRSRSLFSKFPQIKCSRPATVSYNIINHEINVSTRNAFHTSKDNYNSSSDYYSQKYIENLCNNKHVQEKNKLCSINQLDKNKRNFTSSRIANKNSKLDNQKLAESYSADIKKSNRNTLSKTQMSTFPNVNINAYNRKVPHISRKDSMNNEIVYNNLALNKKKKTPPSLNPFPPKLNSKNVKRPLSNNSNNKKSNYINNLNNKQIESSDLRLNKNNVTFDQINNVESEISNDSVENKNIQNLLILNKPKLSKNNELYIKYLKQEEYFKNNCRQGTNFTGQKFKKESNVSMKPSVKPLNKQTKIRSNTDPIIKMNNKSNNIHKIPKEDDSSLKSFSKSTVNTNKLDQRSEQNNYVDQEPNQFIVNNKTFSKQSNMYLSYLEQEGNISTNVANNKQISDHNDISGKTDAKMTFHKTMPKIVRTKSNTKSITKPYNNQKKRSNTDPSIRPIGKQSVKPSMENNVNILPGKPRTTSNNMLSIKHNMLKRPNSKTDDLNRGVNVSKIQTKAKELYLKFLKSEECIKNKESKCKEKKCKKTNKVNVNKVKKCVSSDNLKTKKKTKGYSNQSMDSVSDPGIFKKTNVSLNKYSALPSGLQSPKSYNIIKRANSTHNISPVLDPNGRPNINNKHVNDQSSNNVFKNYSTFKTGTKNKSMQYKSTLGKNKIKKETEFPNAIKRLNSVKTNLEIQPRSVMSRGEKSRRSKSTTSSKTVHDSKTLEKANAFANESNVSRSNTNIMKNKQGTFNKFDSSDDHELKVDIVEEFNAGKRKFEHLKSAAHGVQNSFPEKSGSIETEIENVSDFCDFHTKKSNVDNNSTIPTFDKNKDAENISDTEDVYLRNRPKDNNVTKCTGPITDSPTSEEISNNDNNAKNKNTVNNTINKYNKYKEQFKLLEQTSKINYPEEVQSDVCSRSSNYYTRNTDDITESNHESKQKTSKFERHDRLTNEMISKMGTRSPKVKKRIPVKFTTSVSKAKSNFRNPIIPYHKSIPIPQPRVPSKGESQRKNKVNSKTKEKNLSKNTSKPNEKHKEVITTKNTREDHKLVQKPTISETQNIKEYKVKSFQKPKTAETVNTKEESKPKSVEKPKVETIKEDHKIELTQQSENNKRKESVKNHNKSFKKAIPSQLEKKKGQTSENNPIKKEIENDAVSNEVAENLLKFKAKTRFIPDMAKQLLTLNEKELEENYVSIAPKQNKVEINNTKLTAKSNLDHVSDENQPNHEGDIKENTATESVLETDDTRESNANKYLNDTAANKKRKLLSKSSISPASDEQKLSSKLSSPLTSNLNHSTNVKHFNHEAVVEENKAEINNTKITAKSNLDHVSDENQPNHEADIKENTATESVLETDDTRESNANKYLNDTAANKKRKLLSKSSISPSSDEQKLSSKLSSPLTSNLNHSTNVKHFNHEAVVEENKAEINNTKITAKFNLDHVSDENQPNHEADIKENTATESVLETDDTRESNANKYLNDTAANKKRKLLSKSSISPSSDDQKLISSKLSSPLTSNLNHSSNVKQFNHEAVVEGNKAEDTLLENEDSQKSDISTNFKDVNINKSEKIVSELLISHLDVKQKLSAELLSEHKNIPTNESYDMENKTITEQSQIPTVPFQMQNTQKSISEDGPNECNLTKDANIDENIKKTESERLLTKAEPSAPQISLSTTKDKNTVLEKKEAENHKAFDETDPNESIKTPYPKKTERRIKSFADSRKIKLKSLDKSTSGINETENENTLQKSTRKSSKSKLYQLSKQKKSTLKSSLNTKTTILESKSLSKNEQDKKHVHQQQNIVLKNEILTLNCHEMPFLPYTDFRQNSKLLDKFAYLITNIEPIVKKLPEPSILDPPLGVFRKIKYSPFKNANVFKKDAQLYSEHIDEDKVKYKGKIKNINKWLSSVKSTVAKPSTSCGTENNNECSQTQSATLKDPPIEIDLEISNNEMNDNLSINETNCGEKVLMKNKSTSSLSENKGKKKSDTNIKDPLSVIRDLNKRNKTNKITTIGLKGKKHYRLLTTTPVKGHALKNNDKVKGNNVYKAVEKEETELKHQTMQKNISIEDKSQEKKLRLSENISVEEINNKTISNASNEVLNIKESETKIPETNHYKKTDKGIIRNLSQHVSLQSTNKLGTDGANTIGQIKITPEIEIPKKDLDENTNMNKSNAFIDLNLEIGSKPTCENKSVDKSTSVFTKDVETCSSSKIENKICHETLPGLLSKNTKATPRSEEKKREKQSESVKPTFSIGKSVEMYMSLNNKVKNEEVKTKNNLISKVKEDTISAKKSKENNLDKENFTYVRNKLYSKTLIPKVENSLEFQIIQTPKKETPLKLNIKSHLSKQENKTYVESNNKVPPSSQTEGNFDTKTELLSKRENDKKTEQLMQSRSKLESESVVNDIPKNVIATKIYSLQKQERNVESSPNPDLASKDEEQICFSAKEYKKMESQTALDNKDKEKLWFDTGMSKLCKSKTAENKPKENTFSKTVNDGLVKPSSRQIYNFSNKINNSGPYKSAMLKSETRSENFQNSKDEMTKMIPQSTNKSKSSDTIYDPTAKYEKTFLLPSNIKVVYSPRRGQMQNQNKFNIEKEMTDNRKISENYSNLSEDNISIRKKLQYSRKSSINNDKTTTNQSPTSYSNNYKIKNNFDQVRANNIHLKPNLSTTYLHEKRNEKKLSSLDVQQIQNNLSLKSVKSELIDSNLTKANLSNKTTSLTGVYSFRIEPKQVKKHNIECNSNCKNETKFADVLDKSSHKNMNAKLSDGRMNNNETTRTQSKEDGNLANDCNKIVSDGNQVRDMKMMDEIKSRKSFWLDSVFANSNTTAVRKDMQELPIKLIQPLQNNKSISNPNENSIGQKDEHTKSVNPSCNNRLKNIEFNLTSNDINNFNKIKVHCKAEQGEVGIEASNKLLWAESIFPKYQQTFLEKEVTETESNKLRSKSETNKTVEMSDRSKLKQDISSNLTKSVNSLNSELNKNSSFIQNESPTNYNPSNKRACSENINEVLKQVKSDSVLKQNTQTLDSSHCKADGKQVKPSKSQITSNEFINNKLSIETKISNSSIELQKTSEDTIKLKDVTPKRLSWIESVFPKLQVNISETGTEKLDNKPGTNQSVEPFAETMKKENVSAELTEREHLKHDAHKKKQTYWLETILASHQKKPDSSISTNYLNKDSHPKINNNKIDDANDVKKYFCQVLTNEKKSSATSMQTLNKTKSLEVPLSQEDNNKTRDANMINAIKRNPLWTESVFPNNSHKNNTQNKEKSYLAADKTKDLNKETSPIDGKMIRNSVAKETENKRLFWIQCVLPENKKITNQNLKKEETTSSQSFGSSFLLSNLSDKKDHEASTTNKTVTVVKSADILSVDDEIETKLSTETFVVGDHPSYKTKRNVVVFEREIKHSALSKAVSSLTNTSSKDMCTKSKEIQSYVIVLDDVPALSKTASFLCNENETTIKQNNLLDNQIHSEVKHETNKTVRPSTANDTLFCTKQNIAMNKTTNLSASNSTTKTKQMLIKNEQSKGKIDILLKKNKIDSENVIDFESAFLVLQEQGHARKVSELQSKLKKSANEAKIEGDHQIACKNLNYNEGNADNLETLEYRQNITSLLKSPTIVLSSNKVQDQLTQHVERAKSLINNYMNVNPVQQLDKSSKPLKENNVEDGKKLSLFKSKSENKELSIKSLKPINLDVKGNAQERFDDKDQDKSKKKSMYNFHLVKNKKITDNQSKIDKSTAKKLNNILDDVKKPINVTINDYHEKENNLKLTPKNNKKVTENIAFEKESVKMIKAPATIEDDKKTKKMNSTEVFHKTDLTMQKPPLIIIDDRKPANTTNVIKPVRELLTPLSKTTNEKLTYSVESYPLKNNKRLNAYYPLVIEEITSVKLENLLPEAQKFHFVNDVLDYGISNNKNMYLNEEKNKMSGPEKDLISQELVFKKHLYNFLMGDNAKKNEDSLESLNWTWPFFSSISIVESQVIHPDLHYRGVIECVAKFKDHPVVIEWKLSNIKEDTPTFPKESAIRLSALMGALNYDDNFTFQVTKGIIIIAYTTGEPADIFALSSQNSQMYWKMWLNRFKNYSTEYKSKSNTKQI